MYPSDYGYASSGCRNAENLYNYRNTICRSTNWLYINNVEWILTPAKTMYSYYVHFISRDGYVGHYDARDILALRPVTYLLSSVKITEGDGTSSSPYILSM